MFRKTRIGFRLPKCENVAYQKNPPSVSLVEDLNFRPLNLCPLAVVAVMRG